tara:strand:+ start:759 stop:1679 length:921 start_codon:yes stop_codon:yes gene_type:complete
MRSLAVITTFPPNRWEAYAKRMLESFIANWPNDVKLYVYYEKKLPEIINSKIEYINLEEVNPGLVKFKERHKNDPVANGELQEIPNGVRRRPEAGKNDKGKGSFLWDAVRFAHKTYCVYHAIRNINTDIILWLDADTYTFKSISKEFVLNLIPENKLVNYLGRGDKFPECGWVSYNKQHPQITEFINAWIELYEKDTLFKHLEWHDSYVFWQVLKQIAPDQGADIGKGAGAKGHHIFVNSVLGEYIDHLKGKRKIKGKSSKTDLRVLRNQDYWKNVESYNPFAKSGFDPKQAKDIINKVAKGNKGN